GPAGEGPAGEGPAGEGPAGEEGSAPPLWTCPEVVVAALLHDVGKVEAGLGTGARVVATLVASALGRPRVAGWITQPGWAGRLGRYVAHASLGAELLERVGSHPLVRAWAAEHHRPPHLWSVPGEVGARLKAADDD
ncbi:MAG: hypothetical protein ACRD0L_12300, partial [Acidimicrobiales bacterium]